MKLKKLTCCLCAALIVLTAVPLPLVLPASADKPGFSASMEKNAAPDVTFAASPASTAYKASVTDVLAAQIVLTDDVLALSVATGGKGSVTLGLFSFVEDYDTSLLYDPIAEYTFDGVTDGAHLTLYFPSDAPLAAGEYLLLAYDTSGVSVLSGKAHESQRAYVNGEVNGSRSFAVSADYAGKPTNLYGKPTVPVATVDDDPAPHMSSVMDFREPTGTSFSGGGNQITLTYMDVDGERFTRFQPSTDASDPFVFLNLPGVAPKTEEYKYLLMKVRIDEDAPLDAQVFFITDECSIKEQASLLPKYKQTTEWQYLILNLGANSLYTGQLTTLRYDVFRSVKGLHYVDVAYMALFKTKEAATAFHDNFEDFKEAEPITPDKTEPDYSTYIASDDPAPVEAGKLTANGALSYIYKEYPHSMDMSRTVDEYVALGEFGFYALSNALIMDGRLLCRAFESYAFFTKDFLGDAYGVRGGTLSMDTALSYGSMTVTLRQATPNDDLAYSGIAFTLHPDGRIDIKDCDGFATSCETGVDFSVAHRVVFRDACDALEVEVDGKVVCAVQYDFLTSTVTLGDVSHVSPHLPAAGYATVTCNRARGFIDNVTYIHTDIVPGKTAATFPVDYSTWIATDDLGRTTPTATDVGDPTERYVGLFYFMCHNHLGGRYANDITRWYLEEGTDALKNRLSSMAGRNGAYWAEPYFGYYSSYDTWVFRKHAYMLDAAGVDFIFLDLSNDVFYTDCVQILFDTWLDIRRNGGHTPQIAFMFGDMPYTFVDGLYTLQDFLTNPEYEELLFKWEGKPLVLGNNDGTNVVNGRFRTWTVSATTPQSREQFKALLNDHPQVKDFYDNEIQDFLTTITVRKCWAWQTGTHKGYWDWLQDSPQDPGRDFDGNNEQMAVTMGTHAHTNKGRSLLGGDTSYNNDNAFGFTLGTAQYGYQFAEQFEYALKQPDLKVIMITGWNEWYAGVLSTSNQNQICGGTQTPGYYMVDQMSPEYSRDGEPMRIRDGVGFGDNYYYQMVSYIRRFKGMTAPATVNGGTIDMSAAHMDAQWENIQPVFTDGVGDAAFRSALGWASEYLYINGTARNDIGYAKISQDADNLYFYVTTANKLITVDDETWMNLYINADNDPSTGWEGYDYLINRSRTDKTVTVERFVDGKWAFQTVGQADYVLGERSLTLCVAKSLLGGRSGDAMSLTFKWADHADVQGNVMRFMELGDAAPSDRFAFAYRATSVKDERPVETETETETSPVTEPETDPVDTVDDQETTAPAPAVSATEPETAPAKKKGCRSSALASAALLILLLSGAAFCRKKKE